MRNIRVIIAFLSIYLFVGAVVLLGLFAVWLSRYYPDSSSQAILEVRTAIETKNENVFSISKNVHGVTALSATVTRLHVKQGSQEAIARITSRAVFVDYYRVTFSEELVPLGYFSMIKIARVSDADGRIIFEAQPNVLDVLWLVLLQKYVETKSEKVTFVAKDNPTSYTVQNTVVGVVTHEN